MGFADWDSLMQELDQHRQAVSQVFDSVISSDEQPETDSIHSLQLFWTDIENNESLSHWLVEAGCDNVEAIT